MVSGLVTSPCDQLRIFSGDARLIRIASKSATGFAKSNGLERNMFLRFPAALTRPPAALDVSSQFPVLSESRLESLPTARLRANATMANHQKICVPRVSSSPVQPQLRTENRELTTN